MIVTLQFQPNVQRSSGFSSIKWCISSPRWLCNFLRTLNIIRCESVQATLSLIAITEICDYIFGPNNVIFMRAKREDETNFMRESSENSAVNDSRDFWDKCLLNIQEAFVKIIASLSANVVSWQLYSTDPAVFLCIIRVSSCSKRS